MGAEEERFRAEAIALVAKERGCSVEVLHEALRAEYTLAVLSVRETERRLRGDALIREMQKKADEIFKYAAYGCGTKNKDARGRQFASIHDLAIEIAATAERYLGGQ